MSLSIKGVIKDIAQPISGTSKAGKDWQKQEFVLETDSEHKTHVCLSLFGEEKMALIDKVRLGDEIEVFFNLSSREHEGKWYHNVDAWKIETV